MKKKIVIRVLIIMCVVFMCGLTFIFSSTSIGEVAENSYRRSQGSYLESNAARVGDNTILSFQLGGLVISLFGGFGMLFSGYALYKEM